MRSRKRTLSPTTDSPGYRRLEGAIQNAMGMRRQLITCPWWEAERKQREEKCELLFSHSVVSGSVTPWTAARQASLPFTISWSFRKLMSIESVMPSNHLILCRPFLLLSSIFPSIRVFPNELALHTRWPKYWSFSIHPSDAYSGLISFRIDSFDFLAVQGTLKSLLQHHNYKVSILQCSVFFLVQLSHPYMTTGKTMLWLCRKKKK